MQVIYAEKRHAGKSLDKVLRDVFPGLGSGALYKAIRKRDIKANGVRVKEDYKVSEGDMLEVYIKDDLLKPDETPVRVPGPKNSHGGFSIVYEDENILIVNKEQGIPVHPDRERTGETLIDNVIRYIGKNKGGRKGPAAFTPSLCHRIDRNTGGLVIIAKNEASLAVLLDKIKNREIEKYYQCLVKGKMPDRQGELKAFLVKDENKSRVFVSDARSPGALEIVTRYKVLSYDDCRDISRLEVELVTGRTHQIRAHLAHIGHPIIGDGKYGTNAINRPLKAKQQALWACRLAFNLKQAGHLNYLRGSIFEVEPDFMIPDK